MTFTGFYDPWPVLQSTNKNKYQGDGSGQSFIHSGYKQKKNNKKKAKNRAGKQSRKRGMKK